MIIQTEVLPAGWASRIVEHPTWVAIPYNTWQDNAPVRILGFDEANWTVQLEVADDHSTPDVFETLIGIPLPEMATAGTCCPVVAQNIMGARVVCVGAGYLWLAVDQQQFFANNTLVTAPAPDEDEPKNLVHLVMGSVDCENCTTVIKAFSSESKAEAFLREIRTYQDTKPSPQAHGEDWLDTYLLWKKAHPAGAPNADKDSYYIESVEVID